MLKRIAVMAAIGTFMSISAHALTIGADGTSIGGGAFKPSNGVSVVVFTNGTSGAFDGTVFAAGAANVKGKKEYATNNSDPKIYSQDAATPGTPTVADDAWAPSGDWVAK
jgi:hypothetical protein